MTFDPLLSSLAEVARDEDAEYRRWEALARGELSAAEEAEIREEAKHDPEVAAKYEAFRPLDDVARARIAKATSAVAAKSGASQRFRRAAPIVLSIAAAAVAVLSITRPTWLGGGVSVVDSPLPDYQLVVEGGDRSTRSAGSHVQAERELRLDSVLELSLRPKTPVLGPVGARGFLVQGPVAQAWNPSLEVSDDGAILVTGRAGELLGVAPGTWDVVLVVGKPSSLPTDPDLVRRSISGGPAPHEWQLFTTRVRLASGR